MYLQINLGACEKTGLRSYIYTNYFITSIIILFVHTVEPQLSELSRDPPNYLE